jgi:hypothetical protein
MKTSQSFTEPSQEQWDEVDRLEHRYFEKFGVRPKRPEFITHEQPTMASVGKYIGDLREMIGKDRSSKRHSTPREQRANRDIERVRRWADLYQKVHGPCAVLSVPADVEAEIKKLKEEIFTMAPSSPRHSREQYTVFGPDGSVKVLMIPEDTPDEEKAFRIRQAYNSLVEQAQQSPLRNSLENKQTFGSRPCPGKPVEHRELCDSFEAKRHYDRMVDEIKFLAELMGGPTFIKDVLGLSGPWETYSPVDNLKRTVSLARYYVKKQKERLEKLEKKREGETSDEAVRDRLINEYRFLKPMSTWYIAKGALERMPLSELIATMDMMREDVKVHMSMGDIPKTSQLSFLAVLDGKTVDITDEFHAWQESVKPGVEELVKAAEDVAERSSTDV